MNEPVPYRDSGLTHVLGLIVQACEDLLSKRGSRQEIMQSSLGGGPDFPADVRAYEWTTEDAAFELAQFIGDSALTMGSQYALWVRQTTPQGVAHYCDLFAPRMDDQGNRSVSYSRLWFNDPHDDPQDWTTTDEGLSFKINRDSSDEITWQRELTLGWLVDALNEEG